MSVCLRDAEKAGTNEREEKEKEKEKDVDMIEIGVKEGRSKWIGGFDVDRGFAVDCTFARKECHSGQNSEAKVRVCLVQSDRKACLGRQATMACACEWLRCAEKVQRERESCGHDRYRGEARNPERN